MNHYKPYFLGAEYHAWMGRSSYYFNRYMIGKWTTKYSSKEAIDYWQDDRLLYIGGSGDALDICVTPFLARVFVRQRCWLPKPSLHKN